MATVEALPVAESGHFVLVYRDHYRRLVRSLRLAGADPATAEDVAQEAFARAWRRWNHVQTGTNPAGYIYRTAFRLLVRRQRRQPAAILVDSSDRNGSGPEDTSVTAADVARALGRLAPRQRACAVLCLAVGLTPTEAAETMHIAPGTVRKHTEAARTALAGMLE